MSRLAELYPSARQLPTFEDDEQFLKALEPYFEWTLVEIDTHSMDILLCDLRESASLSSQRLLILTGKVANLWLRYHRP